MGLNYDYFYSLTPRVFYNILRGWMEQKAAENREHWERTRQLAFFMWTEPRKGFGAITPEKIMPLPWDKKTEVKHTVLTPEEEAEKLQQGFDFWNDYDNKQSKIQP